MRYGLPRDSNGESPLDMPIRRSNFPKTPTVEVNVKAMDSILATLEDIRGKVDLLVQAQGLVQTQHQGTQAQEASSSTPAKNDLERERMKHQATLSRLADTETKLSGLNQELTAVRKDFEEYKASTDAKLEEIMAQLASGARAQRVEEIWERAQALPEAEEPVSSGSDVTLDDYDDMSDFELEEDEEVSAPATKPKALPAKPNKFSALLTQALDASGSSIKAESRLGSAAEPKDLVVRPNRFFDQAKETSSQAIESAEAGESSGLANGPNAFSGPFDRAAKAEAFGKLLFQAERELALADELENPAQDPSAQSNRPSGSATKPKEPVARSTRFSDLLTQFEEPATEPKDTSGCSAKPKALPGSAPSPQDPLTQKIAELEAALHSKTSQISKMEQEHEETVRLMSEQLDNVYERLNPDSQTALDPQEVRDARIELLEERNEELQSIIQANAEEAELLNQKIWELEARLLQKEEAKSSNLQQISDEPLIFQSKDLDSLTAHRDHIRRLRTQIDDLIGQREDLRRLLAASEGRQTLFGAPRGTLADEHVVFPVFPCPDRLKPARDLRKVLAASEAGQGLRETEVLKQEVKKLTEEKNILTSLLQTEVDARNSHLKEASRLRELMTAQAESHRNEYVGLRQRMMKKE